MESTIIVAVLSLIGTLGGSIIAGIVSNNKTLYRIEQLERKWRSITVLLSVWRLLKIHLNLSSTKLMN